MLVEERDDIEPICPYCEADLHKVWIRELREFFGKRFVYFCPTCRKSLGFSHRKGFWMG